MDLKEKLEEILKKNYDCSFGKRTFYCTVKEDQGY